MNSRHVQPTTLQASMHQPSIPTMYVRTISRRNPASKTEFVTQTSPLAHDVVSLPKFPKHPPGEFIIACCREDQSRLTADLGIIIVSSSTESSDLITIRIPPMYRYTHKSSGVSSSWIVEVNFVVALAASGSHGETWGYLAMPIANRAVIYHRYV